MTALEVIRRVEVLGGRLVLEGDQLKLRAEQALPDQVVADVAAQKGAIMIALGAPVDTVIGSILDEIRPELPPALSKLPDERLLVLVNWSIIGAWEKAIRKFSQGLR